MIVGIHQPNYLPYFGFFQKMALSDVFVILDTVQFSHDSFTQRTRIRTKDGSMWLTIPIEKENHLRPINEIILPKDKAWLKKHKLSVIANYSRCNHFDSSFVDEYYSGSEEFIKLNEFNEYGIYYLKEKIGIRTKTVRASELNLSTDLKSTDLLIEILEKVGGDTYLSGSGGKKYIDETKFSEKRMELKYLNYEHFQYLQRWDGFQPNMSALDLVFNLDNEQLRSLVIGIT
jgi:hypothetical protein